MSRDLKDLSNDNQVRGLSGPRVVGSTGHEVGVKLFTDFYFLIYIYTYIFFTLLLCYKKMNISMNFENVKGFYS